MQRFNLIEVNGIVGKAMTEAKDGRWVKHETIALFEAKAKQLGYDDLDDALSALAVYQEMERT